jgi:hypothetical protein
MVSKLAQSNWVAGRRIVSAADATASEAIVALCGALARDRPRGHGVSGLRCGGGHHTQAAERASARASRVGT